jgi:hypothetical protein
MRSRAIRASAVCKGQLVLAGHAVIALALAFLGEAGAQVGGDAGHVLGADGLDAHVLQRVEHLARLAAGGGAGGVGGLVVVAQLERHGVGGAAQLGHLGGGRARVGRGRRARLPETPAGPG